MSQASDSIVFQNFISLLKKCQIQKNNKQLKNESTHTSIGYKTSGVYNIIQKDFEDFIQKYSECLDYQILKKQPLLYIIEKRPIISQITLDLDFIKNIEEQNVQVTNQQKRLYTNDFIQNFISIYMNVLQKFVILKDQHEVFVLEKSRVYYTKGKIKDGIHIHIPSIVIDSQTQSFLRKQVLEKTEFQNLYKKLQTSNSNSQSFDDCTTKSTGWFMYGSQKPNNEPYLLTKVYQYSQNGRLQIKTLKKNTFSVQSLVKLFLLKNDKKQQQVDEILTNLCKQQKQQLEKQQLSKQNNQNQQLQYTNDKSNQLASQLTKILKKERSDNRNDWMYLGWCLKNIDNSLLDCWKNFSSLSSKYDEQECEHLWRDQFEKRGMTIATLKMWAQEDNPDQYKKIMQSAQNDLIKQSIAERPPQHFKIASVIHNQYQGIFMCSDIKNQIWWQFKNHKWQTIDQGYQLHISISQDLVSIYNKYKNDYKSQLNEKNTNMSSFIQKKKEIETNLNQQSEKDLRESTINKNRSLEQFQKQLQITEEIQEIQKQINNLQKKIQNIDSICLKLNNVSFKTSLMKETSNLLYRDDPKFSEKLDQNQNLIGFENGVYDLEKKIFRQGFPDDYLTLSCLHDYKEYNEQDSQIQEIYNYMKQVFIDEQTRKYVWYTLSTFVSGQKFQEKFFFFNGCGSNSKSGLVKLLQYALGEYCTDMPVSAVTRQRAKANEANPELIKCKGKRLVIMQEPERNERLNIGVMKEYTGGDRIPARQLFQNAISFTPQFQMILQCNHLPHIPSLDYGTWRRILVFQFKSLFCENPQQNAIDQFKVDHNFMKKIKTWGPYMLSILLFLIQDAPQKILQVPDTILNDTNKYQRDCDSMLAFLEDKLEILQDPIDDQLTINTLYNEYLDYCRHHQHQNLKQDDLRQYLNKLLKIQNLKNSKFNMLRIKI